MKRLSLLLALPVLSFAGLFGDKGPSAYDKAQAQAQSAYPAASWIWAIGESSLSPEDAEARARAKVSEQIDLQVRSSLSSQMNESRRNGSGDLSSKVVWDVSKSTRFDNAQIIHCDRAVKSSEGWLVVATLSRDAALGALVQQYEDTAVRYRRRVTEALQASYLAQFMPSWRECVRLGTWLKLQGVRFVSLKGLPLSTESMGRNNPHPRYVEDMGLLGSLDSARVFRLGQQRIALLFSDLQGFQVRAGMVVKDAGLAVAPGNAEWTIGLQLEKTDTSESAIGEIRHCRLVPVLDLHQAATMVRRLTVDDAAGEGFKVRDLPGACVEAREKVDAVPLEAALSDLLRATFPIP